MVDEDSVWMEKHHLRIRWTKRLLRYLPRRANIHRYPGLKWASDIARKRMYLWSFRYREVAPALYVGTILSFMPVFGIQLPLAFLLALLFRANLPVFIALQFITNWLTVVPLYYICYEIGRFSLKAFDVHVDVLSMEEWHIFIDNLTQSHWADNSRFVLRVLGVTSLGSLIVGSFLGTVFDQIYKLLAWRAEVIWKRVAIIRQKHAAKKASSGRTESTDRDLINDKNRKDTQNS